MGAGTNLPTTDGSSSDKDINACGNNYGHAFSILTSFVMKDANNNEFKMIMFRNPWGSDSSQYSGPWFDKDKRWTDDLAE